MGPERTPEGLFHLSYGRSTVTIPRHYIKASSSLGKFATGAIKAILSTPAEEQKCIREQISKAIAGEAETCLKKKVADFRSESLQDYGILII